ncbi:PREDICTED: putative tyrosine-protein kinase Wsck [Cyphomyrmex costatus]|uniref:Putative tyrosine-protein kinase Wsck n=1 Tax=Cyphomyrmex costatus TaxID=456900 RepID=A0A195CSB9_9HYME|nr:PREDICTED: putative tyrosine-protein kinase Wsck [Cyphomyrmex costatus]KYN03009.1 Putative tyrosine-protein kinase Wsck [Cyphomyrmex costatus]
MIIASLLFFCGVYSACAQKYEGCFESSYSNNSLPTPALAHASTPAECVKKCHSQYYMFAGLMNGQQCYCINKFGQPSDSCTVPCASDSSYYCGSYEAMSVYATGQRGPSPPRRVSVSEETKDTFKITWQPPDIPNGKVILYTIRAVVEETFSSNDLPPIESQIQGGSSNMTILRGLQPGTKYHISITASNTQESSESANVTGWTLIGPPDKPAVPKILERGNNTITVMFTEGHSEYGPISAYQVLVVQADAIPPPAEDEYLNYKSALEQGLSYYIAAQFDPLDFHSYRKFVVGDGKIIGGYHNVPLKDHFASAQIGLVIISRMATYEQRSYSNLTSIILGHETNQMDTTALALCIAITLLSILLAISILVYFVLRRRHERFHMQKLPEQQELTLQGPVYEVDNMGYIPEDIPERVNHYQELKKKVWSISQNDLSIDDHVIRRGRFGSVHTGTVLKDDKSCPVTIHTIVDGALKGSDKRHMLRELDVCIRAGSMKYLASLVGTCETTDMLYVVLELPPQILKDRLLGARSGDVFPIDRIMFISSSIAIALQYLASHKIIHSRLCARSVGLTSDGTPKLIGHGIAKYALQDLKYARWMAIECFDNQTKHQPGVIWAFGVLLWEIFSMGGTPYSNLTLDSEVEDAIMQGVRLPQLVDVTDPIYEVMLSCWRDDPEERPTFDELIRLDTLSVCPITAITEPYLPELELN